MLPEQLKTKPPLEVLIIDSDVSARSSIASALSQAGFETVTASDCVAGLRKLSQIYPHLVLLAEALPNSAETCLQICSFWRTPVIILGNAPDGEAWLRAVALGADAYLRKSIGKLELIARVKAILRRYQRE